MQLAVPKATHPPQNPNYETDIVHVTRHNKWVLNSIGIWPAVRHGFGKFLPKIAFAISNLVLLFTLLQCVLHIIYEQKDPLLRLKITGLTCFSFISLMKYWAMMVRKADIEFCIGQLQNDWKQVELQRDRKLMLRYGKMGRNLTVCSAIFMYSSGIIYHTIMQYAIGSYVDEYNRTIKLLVYPTYSELYDVQKSPVYELVYVLQCMCGYVFDTVTAAACGLAALFTTHACGQVDVIMARLDDLLVGKYAEEYSNAASRLIEIVGRHTRVLRYSSTVERVMQEICFLEFVGSTFVICLLEYYCLTDWEQNNMIGLTTYTLLLISLTFNMFLLCYTGDLLIQKGVSPMMGLNGEGRSPGQDKTRIRYNKITFLDLPLN